MGAVFGHLVQIGYSETIFSFAAGHSSFELLGIVISGMAGLKIASALINPGRISRKDAIINNSKKSVKLIYGVIAMLVLAAFIEAFWSSISFITPQTKYIAGGALWVLLFLYFLIAGRHHGS